MAATAFKTVYRDEWIAGFEVEQSLLRKTVTTEARVNGNSAVFGVIDSGGATTVTRGVNGRIQARQQNITQVTATLTEEHDLVEETGFNIAASQGASTRRAQMQRTSYAVVNRKVDSQIITALEAGTLYAGVASVTADLGMVVLAKGILGNNEVPLDGNISAIISPAFEGYLMQVKEFGSADYVNSKPFTNQPRMFTWYGVNWIVHPNVTGVGTSTEKCIMYHKNAIGHAIGMDEMEQEVGYNAEQGYSFARTSFYGGAKLLQNTGVIIMRHDGSAFVATA